MRASDKRYLPPHSALSLLSSPFSPFRTALQVQQPRLTCLPLLSSASTREEKEGGGGGRGGVRDADMIINRAGSGGGMCAMPRLINKAQVAYLKNGAFISGTWKLSGKPAWT